jgi:Zn-dependent protease with chaperone function
MFAAMPKVDLDFQRYVARRKGARDAMVREGAAYAYAGDLKLLRTLDRLSPVRAALETSGRIWRERARAETLSAPSSHAAVNAIAQRCAERLHVAAPTIYLAAKPPFGAHTFGTNEDAWVVLDRALIESLTEPELTDVLGRELGHIQNNHVVFGTARYYLRHFAATFVRWVVTPALMALDSWSKRADVTGDRAGLLCTRDLDSSQAALRKLLKDDPRLQSRLDALALFAESAYYRGILGQEGGASPGECDAKVAELIK